MPQKMHKHSKIAPAATFAFSGLLLLLHLPCAYGQSSSPSDSRSTSPTNGTETEQEKGSRASIPQEADISSDPESMVPHLSDTRFWLSGQMNFIAQWHPPFHAAYSGPNSLSPNYEKALSRVLTLYTGVRLNDSAELLVDVEEAGGTALSTGLGLAGNTDLDIVRNPSLSKAPYLARAMIHKVFALSEDKVENERNALSLFAEVPRRRLELRFGKFSMVDFFDQNSIATDTHFQFIN